LNWEDNSGCAPQLTSFTLKIFQVGDGTQFWFKLQVPTIKNYVYVGRHCRWAWKIKHDSDDSSQLPKAINKWRQSVLAGVAR
jgi:hypothetical protein